MGKAGKRPWGRAVAVVCLAATSVVAGAAPGDAQAGSPTLTVEPTVLDTPGGEVEVTYTNIEEGPGDGSFVAQCAAAVVDGSGADPVEWCRTMWEIAEPTRTITAPVYAGFRSASGRLVVCAEVPGGCVVAVGAVAPAGLDAFVPIQLAPPVDVTVTPSEGVAAGQDVDVAIAGLDPGATYGLHHCRDFVWDAQYCLEAPAAEVVAGPDGTAAATVEAPMEIFPNSMSCEIGPCGVGVVTEERLLVGMGTYAARDATVSVTPREEITAGQPVQVDLAGLAPGRNYTIRACHPNIAANAFLANSCATSPDDAAVVAGADGTATATLVPPWTVDAGGAVTSCQAYYCTLGAVLDGTDWVVGSGGYGFAQPTATLTPDTGLVDGEAVTLTVEGLRPGGRFHLRLCPMATVLSRYGTTDCAVGADDPALVPGPDGTATATIAVSQRIVAPNGREHVCRDEVCAVAVVDDELDQVPAGVAYALAQARLTATPDSGLSDGDTVTLSGAGVMASYAGPTLWIFPTGRWSLGQCAATVADDVTIGGVFSTCAPLPGAEPLHVPGSTFEAEVTVRAEVDPVLGGPVDCTTAPGACVLALARIESDGTVTVHTTPVTFD